MRREKDFSEATKIKALLWSNRHCCICDKSCGLDIEIHHIDPDGGKELDNAIPVCYDCHARLGRYMDQQPKGSKYRIEEIKKRRNQIYERYTADLIPAIVTTFHPRKNEVGINFPRVGFSITPSGRFIPVRAKLSVRVFLGKKDLGEIKHIEKPYYSGGIEWSLNPGITFTGNFTVPEECVESSEAVVVQLNIIVIDPYDREHELLPVCFAYVRPEAEEPGWWFMEPTTFQELKKHLKADPEKKR